MYIKLGNCREKERKNEPAAAQDTAAASQPNRSQLTPLEQVTAKAAGAAPSAEHPGEHRGPTHSEGNRQCVQDTPGSVYRVLFRSFHHNSNREYKSDRIQHQNQVLAQEPDSPKIIRPDTNTQVLGENAN